MKLDISKTLAIAVATVLALLGVSVLAGWIPVRRSPSMRIGFGVVLLLYAAYRLALAWRKPRPGRDRSVLPLLLAAALGVSGCSSEKAPQETPTRGSLELFVSESHASLMRTEAEQFMKLYPDARVTVHTAQTREAIVHFLNDSVPAVVVDRGFNAEESKVAAESGIAADSVPIARDALAFIVHRTNRCETITYGLAESILNGRVSDWSSVPGSGRVGPIRLAATGVNSGAYELATHRFFYFQKTFSPHAVAGSQDEVVQLVAAHPNALGFVSLACLKDTASSRTAKESVRSLDFMGADSTGKPVRLRLHQANVYLAKYPLYFPVWMFVHSAKSPLAVGFSGFVANNPGQQIVLNRGLVPATIPVRLVQLTE